MTSSLTARRTVREWEARLVELNSAVVPVEPADEVWQGIEARLGLGKREPQRSSFLWQGLAAACAVVAVVFGAIFIGQSPEVATADYVAVVTDEDTGPVWLVRAFAATGELVVNTITDRPEPENSSYELWMLPDDGSAPVSLGLIPGTGDVALALSGAQLGVLMQTSTLAVSVEPAGGSPTGAPTGPVIYTAPLVAA